MGLKIRKTVATGIYLLESGGYRVKVSDGSRRRGGRSKETGFPAGTGLREMKRWQDDARADLRRQALVPVKGTLEADIPLYLSKIHVAFPTSRKAEINAWVPTFGARRRHTIKRSEIESQISDWQSEGVAASTIRHRLSALSKLYKVLDGRHEYNPVTGVDRPPEPEPDAHETARPLEVQGAVLDALWFRVAMNNRGWKTLARALVLAHTGIRPSQLMRMKPELHILPRLDGEEPEVAVPRGKSGRAYWEPLNDYGVAAFMLLLRVGAVGHYSTSSVYKSWMLACDDAGVERFCPYTLRHTFGTETRHVEDADLADVQDLMGHKSPKTTLRYAAPASKKQRRVVRCLGAAWDEAYRRVDAGWRGQTAWAQPESAESKAASGT